MDLNKRLLAVLAVVCILAGTLYVGGSGMTMNREEKGLLPGKETIYFWYTDEALTDYVNSAAVTFGEENHVRVIPVLTSGTEYLEAIHEASLKGEQVPDAYLISNEALGKAYLAGLAGMVRDEGKTCTTDNFPAAALSAVTYQNNVIAYPYYYETSALLYNKTYLKEWAQAQLQAEAEEAEGETADTQEEAELTPEERKQIEDKVMESLPSSIDDILTFADSYDAPAEVEAVLKWDVSDIFYNYHFVGNYMKVGGDAGDNPKLIDIDNPDTVHCLKVYQNLNQFFYIEPKQVDYASVMKEFMEGKIVYTIATTDALKMLEQAKSEDEFAYEYGMTVMPSPGAEWKGRSLSVTNAVAINGYSSHKELANRFAQFLTNEYVDTLYARTGKVSASYHAPYDNPELQVFMKEYENSVPLPKMIETSNFWIELEIAFSKIWGGASVEDMVRELSEQIVKQTEELQP